MPKELRPSLIGALLWIGLGVLFLLRNFGIVPDILTLAGRYWPVLLILFGAGKVIEYFLKKDSIAIRFGEAFNILLLIVFGVFISAVIENGFTRSVTGFPFRVFREFRVPIGSTFIQPGEWIGKSHTFTEEAVYPLADSVPVRIENSYGMISISPGSDREVRTRLKKVIFAEESSARDLAGRIHLEGKKVESESAFVVKTNRGTLSLGKYRVDTNMEVFVPRSSRLVVRNSYGAVRAVGINGKLDLSTTHQSLEVRDCSGQFVVSSRYGECRLANLVGNLSLESRGKVALENIKGDVSVTDEYSPIGISDVDGKVTVSSTEGELRIDRVSQPVVVQARGTQVNATGLRGGLKVVSSHKDIRVEDVDSDVSIESSYAKVSLKGIRGNVGILSNTDRISADDIAGDLTLKGRGSEILVNGAAGALDIRTTLKGVIVNDCSGDCRIVNEYADVSLSMSKLDANQVAVTNRNGGIVLYLPERAEFSMNATARQGRVESFYPGLNSPASTGNISTLETTGKTSKARIRLETEYNNIRIYGSDRK